MTFAPLIIDACCFINLCASRYLEQALANDDWEYWMAESALDESLYLRGDDPDNPGAMCQVPLNARERSKGCGIQESKLAGDDEFEWYVNLAQVLDDGEAYSMAVAKCRGFRLGTDDQKALKWAHSEALNLCTATTPEIIRHWIDDQLVDTDALTLIRNIEKYGRFQPRPSTRGYDWWVRWST